MSNIEVLKEYRILNKEQGNTEKHEGFKSSKPILRYWIFLVPCSIFFFLNLKNTSLSILQKKLHLLCFLSELKN